MTGIESIGVYVPRSRIARSTIYAANAWFAPGLRTLSSGERAFANWDEDAITMGLEAARDCLRGRDRAGVGSVVLASTTHPFADRQNAGVIKEALNLPDAVASLDSSGGLRAGTSSLAQALRHTSGPASLVIAADRRPARPASEAELINGDAAAAVLVGDRDPIARLIGAHHVTIDFVDHFRAAGRRFDYAWETRWTRDAGYGEVLAGGLAQALEQFPLAPAKVDHFILALPARGVERGIARRLGIRDDAVADSLLERVGFAGAAHPLLQLALTLDHARKGETVVVAGFGQGCDVLAFEVARDPEPGHSRGVGWWLDRRAEEPSYTKFLALQGLLEMERGMRAEADQKPALTALHRERRAVLGLVGSRCSQTGRVQFPPSQIMVGATSPAPAPQIEHPLADVPATVLTHTADNLTYTPDPPAYYGAVEFDGGGRLTAEFTDVGDGGIGVGDRVGMMFRIKAVDEVRGFTKYFWKAAPGFEP